MNIYTLTVFLFICSCRQHDNRSSFDSGREKEKTGNLYAKNGEEWVDTVYDKNGKIEQILRGKINTKKYLTEKYLDGRCETYYPTGILRSVKFFYKDTAKGNSLEFYQNGKLAKFSYLIRNNINVYHKDYDTRGRLIFEEGNPFVGYDIKENTTLDTAHIQIFLSDFGFTNLNLFVSPDGDKFVKMNAKDGIVEGTKVFKMWKHTKGLSHISIYMKMIGTDSNARQQVYVDTLSFKR